ncbi:MAG: monofunctional biosynthetic peptidoglycan transglycosylase [Desulfobulbus sp.]|nr:monofunctional biosynthetic peptidoglycan transglycosylase [Desulfobulbus sp.]
MIRLFPRRPARTPEPSSRGGFRRWCSRLFRRLLFSLLLVILLPVVAILVFRWLPVPLSSFMLIRQVERLVSGNKVPPIRYQWVNLEAISPLMPLAVIAGEDQRFPDHFGFDFNAISKALDFNSTHSRKMLGASTISQQTAKNLFLWGERSLLRKGLEAGLTLGLETLWPKERILEVYLNIAEFGDGIYGVQAASTHLFHTSPARLSRRQAALLAAVLPNPRRFHPDRPTSYILGRARWIETNMARLGGTRYLDKL